MKRCDGLSRALALAVAAAAPLPAQEVGLFATSALTRSELESSSVGAGLSLGGTFRLGSLFHESNALSRARLRVGLRLNASEVHSTAIDYTRCIDDCPPGALDVALRLRMVQAVLLLYPYQSATTRVELTGGASTYVRTIDPRTFGVSTREDQWGFTSGAGFARRLRVTRPVWLQVGYEKHGRARGAVPEDAIRFAPPAHSLRLGLLYRFSERR